MTKDKEHSLVEVFAGKTVDVEIVKSLMENAEIEAFLKDENIGNIFPFQAAGGGAGAVKLYISSEDYEKGKEIVEEYYKNIQSDKS